MAAFVVVPHVSADSGVIARLSESDHARLSALDGDDAARQRFLAGRAALFAAADRLGEPEIRIDARCPDCGLAHGRPLALGGGGPVHLALSHAAGSAFAVAARRPVGIDAEPVSGSSDRHAAIETLAPGRGDALRRWTAIEAVLKADGIGLRLPPNAVRVRLRSARLHGVRYRLETAHAVACVVTVAERSR